MRITRLTGRVVANRGKPPVRPGLVEARIDDVSLRSNRPRSRTQPSVSAGPTWEKSVARQRLPTTVREMPAVRGESGEPSTAAMTISLVPAPDRPVLLRREGLDAGAVYSLRHGCLVVGRDPEANLPIRDPGVSRVHARIFAREGALYVEDLGSTNGTQLNGVRVGRSEIRDGDVIELGPAVTLAFALVTEAQETALRTLFETARTDIVTGALQARHFERRLMDAVESAVDSGGALSVLRIRLDDHDRLLEVAGREATDALLARLGATIRQRLGTRDSFGRLGEAEFGVLLVGAPLMPAARVAERLRVAVGTTYPSIQGAMLPLSASIGVASLKCLDVPTSTDLMDRAEQRLRRAATLGGGRVVWED
jgi:two-component system, cell cycle response regulator